MTGKADFTPEEWKTISEGPTSAGMVVLTSTHGGTFKETFAMAKAYTEAREQHGESELLDEIASHKPEADRTHYHSELEVKDAGLQHVRDAIALLESKATPEELEDYRKFVFAVAAKVANAHKEDGQSVSPQEKAAIDEIAGAMGTAAPQA